MRGAGQPKKDTRTLLIPIYLSIILPVQTDNVGKSILELIKQLLLEYCLSFSRRSFFFYFILSPSSYSSQ